MTVTIRVSETHIDPAAVNFCFPLAERIESERVALVPFQPQKHTQELYENCKGDTAVGIYKWMAGFGPYDSPEHLITELWEGRIYPNQGETLFAVYSKHPDGTEEMAGMFGYLHATASHLSAEIGPAITFPRFQGTHVTRNIIGLLLHYALDLPDKGGLGLRRLQWEANLYNVASWRSAEKMGFKKEATLRFYRALEPLKAGANNGKALREGDPKPDFPGRDTVILSVCWDDWENGGRELANEMMGK